MTKSSFWSACRGSSGADGVGRAFWAGNAILGELGSVMSFSSSCIAYVSFPPENFQGQRPLEKLAKLSVVKLDKVCKTLTMPPENNDHFRVECLKSQFSPFNVCSAHTSTSHLLQFFTCLTPLYSVLSLLPLPHNLELKSICVSLSSLNDIKLVICSP